MIAAKKTQDMTIRAIAQPLDYELSGLIVEGATGPAWGPGFTSILVCSGSFSLTVLASAPGIVKFRRLLGCGVTGRTEN